MGVILRCLGTVMTFVVLATDASSKMACHYTYSRFLPFYLAVVVVIEVIVKGMNGGDVWSSLSFCCCGPSCVGGMNL